MRGENMNYIYKMVYKRPENTDEYPFYLPILQNLNELKFNDPVTFICGENGSGKSTLIEAIAVKAGFNSEGGSRNFMFETNENSVSDLHEHILLSFNRHPEDGFFLRAESFYNVATYIDELDKQPANSRKIIESYGGVSLHNQSHGESILSLLYNRFHGNAVYILDEPESALSVSKQYEIMFLMQELVEQDSQFIIATHSPILLSFPNATIYEVNEGDLIKVDYEECSTYRFMKDYINNYKSYIRHI